VRLTNCHIHTFTADHVPDRFAGFAGPLLRIRPLRLALLPILKGFDPSPRDRIERYARMLEISYHSTQAEIFELARAIYPPGTRFVVLPMDMTYMATGTVRVSIDHQHAELRALRDHHADAIVPFAAVDPRQERVVEKTIALIEEHRFGGIKLYPPVGYEPGDRRLEPLYAYAEERRIPVMAHCSRYGVYFRGRRHPVTGERLPLLRRPAVMAELADPDRFLPVLAAHPRLKLCLAHFGGQGEWDKYLDDREDATSWLAKIRDMITAGTHENLYTDVSYTVFAAERNVHLLNDLLDDPRLRSRVLYGSDFYVVEDAKIDEASGLALLKSVLGGDKFRAIAIENPNRYLSGAGSGSAVGRPE
jgi:predicted TIM-barrel fold metal-dependent hydrolase